MITLTHILVPTDFSETSQAAAKYGVALARAFNATLHLLHVEPRCNLQIMVERELVARGLSDPTAAASPQNAARAEKVVRKAPCPPSVALEKLDGAFVPFGGGSRIKSAQVPSSTRSRVHFARIESILAGLELPNHRGPPKSAI